MHTTRKLGSIQIVRAIEKHTNADSLELVTVLGWQVVSKIGDVHVGDKVIYCEVDSMLPLETEWITSAISERAKQNGTNDFFRIKTIRLRWELSQGLIIPLSDKLPPFPNMDEGTDVTEILGIRKYEPIAFSGMYATAGGGGGAASAADQFPTQFLDKTDEPRIQSEPKLLHLLKGKPFYIAIKFDGTSATYFIDPHTQELVVCSRNLIRKRPSDPNTCPYWRIVLKYDIEQKLRQMPHIAIQGEICGPSIQKNPLKLKDIELYVFNLVDIRDKSRLSPDKMLDLCSNTMHIPVVTFEETGESFAYDSIKVLLSKAEGLYAGTKHPREGIVIRSADQTISFKVINNEYLLKNGY